jgi:GNAT superfamily N-acetyltransferase
MNLQQEPLSIEVETPDAAAGRAVLRAYMNDVASRYYGRPATTEEIDAALSEDPSDDLAPPHGFLLVARANGSVVGCAGLRLLADGLGEVKRVFVEPASRGQGIGTRLMMRLEWLACQHGLTHLRLDTRHDLVEARAMYAHLGYQEVPAFNNGRYSEHWFAKPLA